jgi:cytochrome bd-type quinol oxidase subunit 1
VEPALDVHRLHFAFTITFHYLFPQLTMGLALLIIILKTIVLRTGDEHYSRAARFWAKYLASTSRWAWSLAFRWNFSSAPTGRNFQKQPAA